MKKLSILVVACALALGACGKKKDAATTPTGDSGNPDTAGGDAYGADTYGAPAPDAPVEGNPCGGAANPCG